ncbi:MAG: hypothetical protein ACP5FH_05990 [Terracidiphilus sp.]
MALTTTNGVSISASQPVVTIARARPRRISAQAGHALEKLGHAIEYLTDEFLQEGGAINSGNAQLEAVQMLMALNRQIYFECPVAPTFGERCRALLRPGSA